MHTSVKELKIKTMGICKSLQYKAYITGAFHLVLSVFALLFLPLVFLHQATDETRNQKYLEGDETKSDMDGSRTKIVQNMSTRHGCLKTIPE